MKVLIRIKRDSHNTDTTASISVQVSRKEEAVLELPDGRQLVVDLDQLQYAVHQPAS